MERFSFYNTEGYGEKDLLILNDEFERRSRVDVDEGGYFDWLSERVLADYDTKTLAEFYQLRKLSEIDIDLLALHKIVIRVVTKGKESVDITFYDGSRLLCVGQHCMYAIEPPQGRCQIDLGSGSGAHYIG